MAQKYRVTQAIGGVIVSEIAAHGFAHRQGLQIGHVPLEIDGHPTERHPEVNRADQIRGPQRRHPAPRAAQERQEDTLTEQLPHQAEPRRAESRAQRQFPLTTDAPADQQRADIGAGDQQNQ